MEQVQKLVEFLEKCDIAYYVDGNPLVPNETYDALVATLQKLDPSNPYLSKVGHKVDYSSVKKVARTIPMGSLRKYNTTESVKEWFESVSRGQKTQILIGPKYDGFACELDYINGKLVLASTRGDGIVGEDITQAALNNPTIPKTVPPSLTKVRGEFIIPKKYHDILKAAGYTAMRNAVPGIIRSNNEYVKYVNFVAYAFFDEETSREIQYNKYKDLFIIEDAKFVCSFEEIEHIKKMWDQIRDEYQYEIDGLVLKTSEIREDNLLDPEFQIAWKFKSNREATILREIKVQLGVSGKFTPIGIFDQVEFQGAKLTSASLGNFRRLKEMIEHPEHPLKIGSMVEVSRRGDIIPYIEECTYTPDDAQDIELLTHCPHCNQPVVYENDEPYCRNESCPKLLELQISQYVANVGVKGIGQGLITKLISHELVKTLPDLYKFDPQEIAKIKGQGQSSVEKFKAFQEKELTPIQFVCALPFVDIGPAVWKALLSNWNLHQLLEVTKQDIINKKIRGMGESKIDAFINQRDALKSTIKELLNYVRIKG